MATAGPNSPGTTATVAITNGADWANTDNVKVSDNTYATATVLSLSPYTTDFIVAKNFGFAISATAVIMGITVEIEAKNTADKNCYVYVTKNGITTIGSATINVTTTEQYLTAGSSASLWTTTWTYAEINAATFGVMFQAIGAAGTTNDYSVDHIRVTVDYIEPTDKTLSDLVSSVTETVSKTSTTFDYSVAVNNQAYILNRKTGYWTFQDHAPFVNAVYRPSTQKIIASRRDLGQISQFSGTNFDGTNIASVIKTGAMNFGDLDEIKAMTPEASEAYKRLRAYFSEVVGEGNLTLTIYTELDSTGKTFTITLPTTDNATMNVIRTALSRDIKGKYITMKITNSSGNDFFLGEQKIKVIPRAIT